MGESTSWWGNFQLEEDTATLWQIGPLSVRVTRSTEEWRLAWRRDSAEPPEEPAVTGGLPPEDLDDSWTLRRFGFSATTPALRLVPMLSDRPVVTRPEIPFSVQPGQSIRLLVSTPVWLRFEVEGPGSPLAEIPVLRLSDTWFGPSTRHGELCYASRSHLRPAGEPNLLPRWRALTEIALDNRAPDPLSLERLSLPVPRLTLYTDGARLWTSSLRLERVAGEEAGVTVGPAPSVAPQRLSPPRQEGELSLVLRAFNSLFR